MEALESPDHEKTQDVPTRAQILLNCRLIHREETLIFYGTNTVNLYASDNTDILKWILDIGQSNRMLLRHLEIGSAYGVDIAPGACKIDDVLP